MAVIKKNDLKDMTPAAAKAKINELEKAILELQSEGKREKAKPIRRTIAQLKTLIANAPQEKPKEGKV